MVVVALLKERQVRRLGEVGLVVEKVKDADRLLAQHVQDGMVVCEGDRVPLDLLLAVLSLTNR